MRALLQRVKHASVTVDDQCIGTIDHGVLVFLAVEHDDTEAVADKLLHKILHYRIFADDNDKMNLNVQQVGGGVLIVSQFTLAANTQKGLRPNFSSAAQPEHANALYEYLLEKARADYQADKIASGQFAADMQVSLLNDGPVTFLLEA